ncbi:MAG: MGMT family protein [Crocinitomicaceae bacterium]|nr:MGMT family protein [Crocinitomicaceae bacterium]
MDKSDFFENVYAVVKLIPRGRVTSYGAIASYLGSKQSSRMVGWAMNAAHKLKEVPAHRVVNRNGVLTGKHHFETPDRMQELLDDEGVKVINDEIVDFDKCFWNPTIELELP